MSLPTVVERIVDRLKVKVYENRSMLGRAAGLDCAAHMRELLGKQEQVRMIFAAAPSQNEFLETLVKVPDIDWSRVTAFHMDEYIGLDSDAPQRFGLFLKLRLFDLVHPAEVYLIQSSNSPEEECRRYSEIIAEEPIDIVCMGIGENGHIAFNDPPVADFNDPDLMKTVELDEVCRQQQVNDGCFESMDLVPTHALTLTIPALMRGKRLFCMVPGNTKKDAVQRTLKDEMSTACPSTILRQHEDCTLYTDTAAYGEPES
ncbi:glucosamine-6-phosphate deaminase [Paenibacillus uliginis N3/975]|uniref:Glucosamine-6-phosphate deaminase n=1 Tax=Paenibacillus uliginis N3/975 TaxID=1313296 RepID=A0A1X7HNQ1_9BACL|nr:glucosamine-6-phosphate deaminase [Paenibacillus uliginis]SMF89889.1 glucosamine-6-phosphate deaminase [Paenibacillus uliginis N3/975]